MVANIHYRWDFIGLSTDTKPTPATSEKVVDGSTYYCSDNSKLYVFYKDTWYERKALGGGGGGGTTYTAGDGINIADDTISVDTTTIQEKLTAGTGIDITDNTISATGGGGSAGEPKILSEADYNWNSTTHTATAPYDCIAPWLMSPGFYKFPTTVYVVDQPFGTPTTASYFNGRTALALKEETGSGSYDNYICFILYNANSVASSVCVIPFSAEGAAQSNTNSGTLLRRADINNTLTSNSTAQALSARQGRELKALIDALDARVAALEGN